MRKNQHSQLRRSRKRSSFRVSLGPVRLEMRMDHWRLDVVIAGELDKSSFSEVMRVKD